MEGDPEAVHRVRHHLHPQEADRQDLPDLLEQPRRAAPTGELTELETLAKRLGVELPPGPMTSTGVEVVRRMLLTLAAGRRDTIS
jgi:hypothetical protein